MFSWLTGCQTVLPYSTVGLTMVPDCTAIFQCRSNHGPKTALPHCRSNHGPRLNCHTRSNHGPRLYCHTVGHHGCVSCCLYCSCSHLSSFEPKSLISFAYYVVDMSVPGYVVSDGYSHVFTYIFCF
jgi:hypothetical protein